MSASTRVVFSEEFLRAIQIRGLTLRSFAKLSGVSMTTISAAVQGKQINMCTAIALSKALTGVPVMNGLGEWVRASREENSDVAA